MMQRISPRKLGHGVFVGDWLLPRREVSQGAKLCYGRLARYAGEKDECFPKRETLSEQLGMSMRQVDSYIAELEQAGLIEVIRSGKQQPNHYVFLKHEWMPVDSQHSESQHSTQSESQHTDTVSRSIVPSESQYTDTSSIYKNIKKRVIEEGVADAPATPPAALHTITHGPVPTRATNPSLNGFPFGQQTIPQEINGTVRVNSQIVQVDTSDEHVDEPVDNDADVPENVVLVYPVGNHAKSLRNGSTRDYGAFSRQAQDPAIWSQVMQAWNDGHYSDETPLRQRKPPVGTEQRDIRELIRSFGAEAVLFVMGRAPDLSTKPSGYKVLFLSQLLNEIADQEITPEEWWVRRSNLRRFEAPQKPGMGINRLPFAKIAENY